MIGLQSRVPIQTDDRAPAFDRALRVLPSAACSSQETVRHTGELTYRCFLPDLTGFVRRPLRRARPSTPLAPGEPQKTRPRAGIRPRYSGLRVQGTASSPSSTIKLQFHTLLGPETPPAPTVRRIIPLLYQIAERIASDSDDVFALQHDDLLQETQPLGGCVEVSLVGHSLAAPSDPVLDVLSSVPRVEPDR